MVVILKTPQAKIDLIEVWNYIVESSETRADSFIEMIDKKFKTLSQNPAIGRSRTKLSDNLRSFPTGRYVVFYKVSPEGIKIVRILRDARDINVNFF